MVMRRVAVVGAGLMGHGIAQCAAQAGYAVQLWGIGDAELAGARARIAESVAKLHAKGKIADPPAAVLARLQTTTEMADLAGADLYIETVVERIEVKHDIFRRLDDLAPPPALIASNTSTIPIGRLAAVVRHPERCLGIHFTSPVPLMPVAEIIRAPKTDPAVFETAVAFVRSLGKEVIRVEKDVAGFVFNRVNLPSTVEAIRLVEMGAAGVEDIDKAMRLGFGRPMGPFETADMVGLDTGYFALSALWRETGEEKFRPPELLRRKVEAGQLGRKAGRGWYVYDGDGARIGIAPLP
ncbi:MAG: 3-hydroxyacyl-CoA dehydrogenase family protein [Rhodospirillales bacterium]|nr:3-hydroxyacyl-CoA dehydrogenase family protein [Rhodospirillales bacterium]